MPIDNHLIFAPPLHADERLRVDSAMEASWRRWYVLVLLTVVYASNIADRFVISTLIEPIRIEFHLSDSSICFLTGTALAIFYTGMGLPLGMIADRVNRRKLLSISISISSAVTAACGLAHNYLQ